MIWGFTHTNAVYDGELDMIAYLFRVMTLNRLHMLKRRKLRDGSRLRAIMTP